MHFDAYMIETIAASCHEVNRYFCISHGDSSLLPWAETPESIRKSAILGVKHYLMTRCTPEEQHAAWKKSKAEQGYVYGEVKDDEKKTHPCMVEYKDLPDFQKVKDVLFQSVIDGYIKSGENGYLDDILINKNVVLFKKKSK